ncbi:hypothetical protein [Sulfurospirillum barnesii]|uniref:Uncharacterized protein n=1 Tax=Sulfurospirillum barnesii (strain ATCC 700032 / DSM 10660 / SES-3) TaxID=760154 RepID=I3Y0A4_SULBS|nr:hypothetical protein [Sulfurospirillum barnesii]AFL69628.1 hypothetical protein Sulba_2359 [Sulfurospirillum barnesii SES-3]
MLPLILGGVAIAATGYKIKQFLSNEDNLDKINDTLMKGVDWLDSVDQKTEKFFDGLIQKIDESKNKEKLALLLDELDDIKSTTATIIYNDIDELLFDTTKNSCSEIYKPCEIELIRDQKQTPLRYTEENYLIIEKFCDILTTANNFLSQYIDEIKTLPTQNQSSVQPYTLSQNQIKKLYIIQTFLENVICCKVSSDNVTISKVTIRSFNRIKHTIELFKS